MFCFLLISSVSTVVRWNPSSLCNSIERIPSNPPPHPSGECRSLTGFRATLVHTLLSTIYAYPRPY